MKTNKIIFALLIMLFASTAMAALPSVTQVTYTPSPAVPGTTITVLVQIENKDSITQKQVIITMKDKYPFTTKGETSKNIGDIEKYGQALGEFTVYVDPSAENKTYSLPIMISTEQDKMGITTEHNIIISGKDPVIKVISATMEKLLPGEEKEILFTVQNVGTSPAYDILVEMQEDRTVVVTTGTIVEREITPLGAATAYIPSINPGEKKEAALKVSVSNTATIKNYTLPITVSYRNTSGTRTTTTSYAGLKVYSNANLDATIKEQTGNEYVIEIFNKGLGKAEFTLVEIEAQGEIGKPKQFIGSLGASDVDTIKTSIAFEKQGENTITLKLNYMDADAQTKTQTIIITTKSNTTKEEGPNILLIVAVLAIIGFVGWKYFIKKKK